MTDPGIEPRVCFFVDLTRGMTSNTTMNSVKTTISLPKSLYQRLEKYRRKAKLTRSEAIAGAMDDFLERVDKETLKGDLNAFFSDPEIRREQGKFAALGSGNYRKLLEDNPW
jgi:hypothetical protein